MGRPLRINKAGQEARRISERRKRVLPAVEIMAAVTAAVTAVEIMAAVSAVDIMAAVKAAVTAVEIMAAVTAAEIIVVVMVAGILKLIIPTQINPQEQKVGKIEVMETLLKTQNTKAVELEEKEEFQMRVMYQKMRVNIPFLLG